MKKALILGFCLVAAISGGLFFATDDTTPGVPTLPELGEQADPGSCGSIPEGASPVIYVAQSDTPEPNFGDDPPARPMAATCPADPDGCEGAGCSPQNCTTKNLRVSGCQFPGGGSISCPLINQTVWHTSCAYCENGQGQFCVEANTGTDTFFCQ